MFGLKRGASCAMSAKERQLWLGHICGVCIALRDNAGQLARVATNYDAALLSMLIGAQSAETTPTQITYCPFRRQRRLAITTPDSNASRYGAALALLMAGTKIEDHVTDKDGYWHYLRPLPQSLSERWLRQGEKLALNVQFDAQLIRKHTKRQPKIEVEAAASLRFYAEPTMQAAAAVFAHTAMLANKPQNKQPMAEIGRNFGLIIYLLDAYQDIESDVKNNHFNPLVQLYPPHERQVAAQSQFKSAHLALRRAFCRLELAQPDLLRKLLLNSLKLIGERTLGMSRRCCGGACHLPALTSSADFDQDNVDHIKRLKDEELQKPAQEEQSADCDCGDLCFWYACDPCDCCECIDCCETGNNGLDCCDADCCDCCDCCGCCDC